MRHLFSPFREFLRLSGHFRPVVLSAMAVALSGASSPAMAEPQNALDQELENITAVSGESDFGLRNGSLVIAPIPFSNPTIGSGLMLGAGYLFNTGSGSKPSMIGIGALRSDNGSKGAGLSVNLAFDNNRWLFKSLFAQADVRYDLFTPAGRLPISQDGVLARMSLAYGVTSQLSFGAALRYLDTKVTPDHPGLPPVPPPFDQFLNVEIASVGLVADWDRRDDTIYATRGGNLHFEAFRNIALNGLVRDYDKAYLNYTHYFPMGRSGVLVARVSGCGASDGTPFFDQCSLGASDAFRGFSATQFIGLRAASVQVEYRRQLSERLGMVVFGGAGQVGPSLGELDLGGTHGAAGLGARYRVSKKFPLDFSLDASRNNLGENLIYIYVGQRF